jgi:hypothetical protein
MVALFLSAAVTQAIVAEAGAKRISLSDYQSFVKKLVAEGNSALRRDGFAS